MLTRDVGERNIKRLVVERWERRRRRRRRKTKRMKRELGNENMNKREKKKTWQERKA